MYVPLEHEPEVTQEVRPPLALYCFTIVHLFLCTLLFVGLRHRYFFILNALNATDLIAFTPSAFPSAWLSLLPGFPQSYPARQRPRSLSGRLSTWGDARIV